MTILLRVEGPALRSGCYKTCSLTAKIASNADGLFRSAGRKYHRRFV